MDRANGTIKMAIQASSEKLPQSEKKVAVIFSEYKAQRATFTTRALLGCTISSTIPDIANTARKAQNRLVSKMMYQRS